MVIGAIVAVLAGAMILMALGARSSHQRDRTDSVVVFSAESSRTAAALEACLAENTAQGLWLYRHKRWPGALGNAARHQRLDIRDRGETREVVMRQRSDHRLRSGERAQLERCTGQAGAPSR